MRNGSSLCGKGIGLYPCWLPASTRNLTIEGDAVVTRPLVQEIGQFEVAIALARAVQQTNLVTEFLDMCRTQV